MSAFGLRARPRAFTEGRHEPFALWVVVTAGLGLIIGLAAAVTKPTVALLILAVPLLIALLSRPDWLPPVLMATVFGEALSTGSVTVSRAAGPVTILVMILALPSWRRLRLPRVGVLLAVIAYAAWAIASAQWTINPDSSFTLGGTGYALASLGLSLVLMLAIVMFVRRERDLLRLMWTTWTLSTITGLVSILQFGGGYNRSVGVSGDANFFASLQVIALPLGALLAMHVRAPKLRLMVLLGIAIEVGSIVTSLSRGGILALATVVVLLGFQPARTFFRSRSRKRLFLAVVAVGAGVLLIASYSALSARTSSLFSGSDGGSGRTNLWKAAVTGWHEHEVRGLGFGAFIGQSNQLLLRTPGVDFSAYALRPTGQYVHNAYLESLVELGVIGLALFATMLASMAISLRSTARKAAAAGQTLVSSFSRAAFLSLAAFAFTSIFLSTETDRILWVLVGLSIALPRVLNEELRHRSPAEPARLDQAAPSAHVATPRLPRHV